MVMGHMSTHALARRVNSVFAPFQVFLRLNVHHYTGQRAHLPTMQSSWPEVCSLKERWKVVEEKIRSGYWTFTHMCIHPN